MRPRNCLYSMAHQAGWLSGSRAAIHSSSDAAARKLRNSRATRYHTRWFRVYPRFSQPTASAGIPLTHRDFSSSVATATGHAADGKDADPVRWREPRSRGGYHRGVHGSGQHLLNHQRTHGGRHGRRHARRSYRTRQHPPSACGHFHTRIHRGNRQDRKGKTAGVAGCGTNSAVDTYSRMVSARHARRTADSGHPALAQSKSFAERLRSIGATPVLMPAISTADTIHTSEVHEAMGKLREYDYIVFSSTNGVGAFFRALNVHGLDARALAGARIACIGPVTAGALEPYGIRADITAERFVAEGLAERSPRAKLSPGKHSCWWDRTSAGRCSVTN